MTYNANMSPDDIIDMFELLVDDGPDADGVQVLMDSAYTLRNESRIWQMLMKLDSSITHSPSDLWTTEKALPTDFGSVYKGYGGDGQNPYEGVPFEQILNYKGSSNRYTVDTARSKLRFMGGSGSALTFYMFYQYVPTSLIGYPHLTLHQRRPSFGRDASDRFSHSIWRRCTSEAGTLTKSLDK